METKRAFALGKAIKTKTGQSVCIEQSIWSHDDNVKRSYYKLIWFKSYDDCDIQSFKTFQELLDFAKEKWNV
jgi:hypothetical protein